MAIAVDVQRKASLRWYGHIERKEEIDWVNKCMAIEMKGNRKTGRLRVRGRFMA